MGIRCKMAVEEGPVDWEDSQAKKSLSDFVDEPRQVCLAIQPLCVTYPQKSLYLGCIYQEKRSHGGLRERQLGGCPGEQR